MALDKEKYRIFEHISDVDISEQDIWDYEPDVLNQLLIDHTMSAKAREEANDPISIPLSFVGFHRNLDAFLNGVLCNWVNIS